MNKNDQIYTVEAILKKRVFKGQIQYLVKWEGYGLKYNTWEPKENVLDINLIEEFEQNIISTKKNVENIGKSAKKKGIVLVI